MVIQPHLQKEKKKEKKKDGEYSAVAAKTKFKDVESEANYPKQQRAPLEVVTSAILEVI